jgi:hypothetical protein
MGARVLFRAILCAHSCPSAAGFTRSLCLRPSVHSFAHNPPKRPTLLSPPPAQLSVRTMFVRGSVLRYVHVPPEAVDTELLQDAARKESQEAAKAAQRK